MRRGGIILLSGLLLAIMLSAAAQAKPPEGITIKFEAGYNGWVQKGRINPVVVDMENKSADVNLSGELVLELDGVEYVTRLELPTPSAKRFYLYFPADAYPPLLTLRVRTKSYTEQFEVSTYQHVIEAADANIVVLTRRAQHGSLGILNKLPGVRLQRNLYGGLTAGLESSEAFVAYYDIADVDPSPKFFSRADVIVVADIDYQQVSDELAETLKACAAGGTSVVFSLGTNGAGVAGSPLSELCPLLVSGTEQTDDLGAFGRHYGISAAESPATLAVGRVAPGAEIVEWAGKYPAVVRALRGSGRVTALAFDYTSIPFKQRPEMTPIFVDNALKIEDSVQVTDWFIHPEIISNALEGLAEAKPITPSFVLLFLLAYVALIGPANFLILDRLKRRTLVWTTIPLLIIGFSYLGLSTGYFYRGSNNVTAAFQELHIYPNAAYTPYQTTLLVFTAERLRYEMVVPDKSAFVYPDIPAVIDQSLFGGGGGQLRGLVGGQIDNSQQPKITVSQGKWTSKQYMYQGYLQLPVNAAAELVATRQSARTGVAGKFTLDLPFDLASCFLVTPAGGTPSLGTIPGQGTYDIDGLQDQTAGRELNPANYLVAEISQLQIAAQEAVRPGLAYRNEALLIGFTEDIEALAEFKRPHAAHNLTMVVVHLPFEQQLVTVGPLEARPGKLVGGAGFRVYGDNAFTRRGASDQPYEIAKDGYIDVSYLIDGELSQNSTLVLSLVAQQPAAGQLTEATRIETAFHEYLAVEAWDGARWRQIAVPVSDTALEVKISSLISDQRTVILRFRALQDFVFGLPSPNMY